MAGFLGTVIYRRVPQTAGNFPIILATISLSNNILPRVVNWLDNAIP
jgi:hypothetical protein